MRSNAILDNARLLTEVAQEIAVAGIGLRGSDARHAMSEARRGAIERLARERWEAIRKTAWVTRVNVHGGERHDATLDLQADAMADTAAPADNERDAVGDDQGKE
jgi:hypothetical protein